MKQGSRFRKKTSSIRIVIQQQPGLIRTDVWIVLQYITGLIIIKRKILALYKGKIEMIRPA